MVALLLHIKECRFQTLGRFIKYKVAFQDSSQSQDCRNTEPQYNGDGELEPERTIRQKKGGDINCMEEKEERMACKHNYRSPKLQPTGSTKPQHHDSAAKHALKSISYCEKKCAGPQ